MRRPWKLTLLIGVPLVVFGVMAWGLFAQGDPEMGRGTLAAGVIVASVCGASQIYDIERWTLLRRSLIHLAVMAVTVLPALLLSGWFATDTVGGYLAAVGLFLAVGAVLWVVMLLVVRQVQRGRPGARG